MGSNCGISPADPTSRCTGPTSVVRPPARSQVRSLCRCGRLDQRTLSERSRITSRFPSVHGAPVHIGLPDAIGIRDLAKPDYGDAVPVGSDELPVFWACGV